MTREEITTGLRIQSAADRRVRYDGHNRRPIHSSLRRLRWRRWRRSSRLHLRCTISSWSRYYA